MRERWAVAPVHSRELALGVAWMFGALLSFLTMGIAGRELSVQLAPQHTAFYRNGLCLLFLLPFVIRAGWPAIRTRRPGRHVLRNTIHFGGQWCWLFGLGVLPFAEVFAIEFTTPIWAALIASLALGERLTRSRLLAIGLGFAGILVLLRPGLAVVDPAALVVLAAAISYGISFVLTKNLVGVNSPLAVVWWMNVIQLPLGGLLSLGNLVVPGVELWPWVAALGVSGLTSHYCLSRALTHADIAVVAPFDFLRLPLAAVTAWLLYAEPLDPFLALGAALVIAGNWINLRRG